MPLTDTFNDDQKKEFEALLAAEAERLAEEKLAEKALDEEGKRILKKRNDIIDASKNQIKTLETELNDAKTKAARAAEIEAELKKLKDAEEARKVEDDKRRAEEEAAKKKDADSKKSVEERITELSQTFEERLNQELSKRDQQAAEAQQKLLDELSKRDQRILMEAVRAEATKAGILDEELVSLLDLKDVKIENGVPDREKISEVVDSHKSAKPHFYKEDKGSDRGRGNDRIQRTEPERPKPADTKDKKKIDWGSLSEEEFRRMEEEFRKTNRG